MGTMFSRTAFSHLVRQSKNSNHSQAWSRAFAAKAGQAEVILVGCGAPNRGMGWYHAVQMLDKKCPSASLDFIVEPWFMGAGGEGPGGPEFKEWQAEAESKYGTKFATSLDDLP